MRGPHISKAHAALSELPSRHRLLLLSGPPRATGPSDELLALHAFVRPLPPLGHHAGHHPHPHAHSIYPQPTPMLELTEVLGEAADEMSEVEVCKHLLTLTEPFCFHHRPGSSTGVHPSPPVRQEVAIPAELSPAQAEAYRTVLARHFETLADPRPPRSVPSLAHACMHTAWSATLSSLRQGGEV